MTDDKKRVNENDVLSLMKNSRLDISFYEVMWSSSMIAECFAISKYRARKLLRKLKERGDIYYGYFQYPCDKSYEETHCCCDNHLPIWGYRLKKEVSND